MSEYETLTRSAKNKRRKTKAKPPKEPKTPKTSKSPNDTTGKILNFLIGVVTILIIISLVLIFTNDDVITNIKNADAKTEATNSTADGGNDNSSHQNESVTTTAPTEQMTNNSDAESEATGESEPTEEEQPVDLSHITFIDSKDPNVIQAWVNANWTPYPTEQTGEHLSTYDYNHIDFQEKLKLLYRDTNFNESNSVLWSIKNANGDSIAVISTLDRSEIYRLTMKWVKNKGWQTILIEQLKGLEGAY